MLKPSDFELYRLDRDLSRAELIDALAGVPARLREVIVPCGDGELERPLGVGGWSAIEVLRHTRDIAQVYGMRFKWMILNDDPFLPNYDEDRWVAESPDGAREAPQMLDEIAAFRAETVRLLRALNNDGWARTGRHEAMGAVTLDPYVRHELAHEEQHISQLQRALGAGG